MKNKKQTQRSAFFVCFFYSYDLQIGLSTCKAIISKRLSLLLFLFAHGIVD